MQDWVMTETTHKTQVQLKVDRNRSQTNSNVNLKKKVNKLVKQTHWASQKIQKILNQIFRQFWMHWKIFKKQELAQILSKYKSWNHKIPLQKEKKPVFQSIYRLIEQKLKKLQTYLDKNLAKEYIKSLILLAGYLIIYVSKKNGTKQLCVDYQQLNNITIKNWYSLPLINKI